MARERQSGSRQLQRPDVKVVVAGDSGVGKSCFVVVGSYLARGRGHYLFPGDYVPTYFDNADCAIVTVDEVSMTVFLCDTAFVDYCKEWRIRFDYPEAGVVLLSFSIGSRTSFESIQQQWLPEVRQHCPDVPLVLVGMKSDLRTSDPKMCLAFNYTRGEAEVTTEQGHELAAKIGAIGYFETSSVNRVGFNEVLTAALRSTSFFQRSNTKSGRFSWPWKCCKHGASKNESNK